MGHIQTVCAPWQEQNNYDVSVLLQLHSLCGIVDTLHAWTLHFCGTLALQIAQRHYPAVKTSDFMSV